MNNFCFYIISCKKNIPILNLLIYTLKKNLSQKIPIYISMDYKIDLKEEKENIIYIGSEENTRFGKRIYDSLQHVKEKYIIVLCDDFIVEKEINLLEIETLIKCMNEDDLISSISLESVSGKNEDIYLLPTKLNFRYILRHKYGNYKTTLQCSIWNKYAFGRLMKNVSSPWEFELFSNQKSYLCKNKFYALNNSERAIEYNRGCFVIRGKIVKPELHRLEKVLNKKIEIEGFEYTDSYDQIDLGIIFKIKRRIKLILGCIYYRIYSYFREENLNNEEL